MDDIVDRLNGRYSVGPHLPNGKPEFGWRQFQATPINQEAAELIEALREALKRAADMLHSIAGDIEDGYALADMRGKYVLAVLAARDAARVPLAFRRISEHVKPVTE